MDLQLRRVRALALLRRSHSMRVFRPFPLHRISDRKSTRLNSSHRTISYAVFCLKKKNNSYQTSQLSTRLTMPRPEILHLSRSRPSPLSRRMICSYLFMSAFTPLRSCPPSPHTLH